MCKAHKYCALSKHDFMFCIVATPFNLARVAKTATMRLHASPADRLMGFKENGIEVTKNMPGVLAKEAY